MIDRRDFVKGIGAAAGTSYFGAGAASANASDKSGDGRATPGPGEYFVGT